MGRIRYQRRVKAGPAVAGIAGPVNTVAPVITGDVAGETSSVSDGTWTGSPSFTYQWFLDGVALSGETADEIETDAEWVGQSLGATVYGANGAGIIAAAATPVVLTEGSAYTGPLDLVPGAVVAYGVRALSAAMLGQNIFRLRNFDTEAEMDFAADAVTGGAPSASVITWLDGAVGVNIEWNDQSGNARDAVEEGNLPEWQAAQFGTVPAFFFDSSFLCTAGAVDLSPSFTMFAVVKNYVSGDAGSVSPLIGANFGNQSGEGQRFTFTLAKSGDDVFFQGQALANFGFDSAGGQAGPPITFTSAAHLVECSFEKGTRLLLVDGTALTFDSSDTGAAVSNINFRLGIGADDFDGSNGAFYGSIAEIVLYNSVLSGANRTALRQNIATYFGITIA